MQSNKTMNGISINVFVKTFKLLNINTALFIVFESFFICILYLIIKNLNYYNMYMVDFRVQHYYFPDMFSPIPVYLLFFVVYFVYLVLAVMIFNGKYITSNYKKIKLADVILNTNSKIPSMVAFGTMFNFLYRYGSGLVEDMLIFLDSYVFISLIFMGLLITVGLGFYKTKKNNFVLMESKVVYIILFFMCISFYWFHSGLINGKYYYLNEALSTAKLYLWGVVGVLIVEFILCGINGSIDWFKINIEKKL